MSKRFQPKCGKVLDHVKCYCNIFSIFLQVYISTVSLLSDDQLHQLGLTAMGEIATLRAACAEVVEKSVKCGPGRPQIEINIEIVELMREANFSWKEISEAMLVSRTTLWRRLKQSGYNFRKHTDISDYELDNILRYLNAHYPHTGLSIICGHLESFGLHIQRRRITDALQRIDPVGRSQRWHAIVRRTPYSVPGPNSLWHVDGHHSLVKWRVVIHGGIDGYSRLIVFLHASTNNCAATVFQLFFKATQVFGVPSRVRSDKGGENVDVCYFMIMHRGAGRGSHIAGSSTHNQRIERLWRDVYRCVCSLFHSLFYYMEAIGVLDPANDSDLFVLHSVFLPRINFALHEFALAWNLHPMRTMHNWSPRKAFYNGAPDDSSASGLRDAVDNVSLESFMSLYGVDCSVMPHMDSEYDEVVPSTLPPVSPELVQNLLATFDPLQEREDYGIGLYISARETLSAISQRV